MYGFSCIIREVVSATNENTMITTRLYLDTRQTKDAETPAPLKIAINWQKQAAYIFTGFKMPAAQWDAKLHEAKDKATQMSISRFKLRVDTRLAELQEAGRLDGLNASEIKKLLERELSPRRDRKKRFMECLETFAASRPQPRTTEIYLATASRIRAFDPEADLLTFDEITIGWLDRFDSFLAITSPKKNARNIHLRNIRSVFNYALREGITTCYPFRQFLIRPEDTPKRSLSAEQLRTLFNAEVKPWQQKYIDFFKMSFMLIGMNTEDLLHAGGIVNGRLEYNRAKTHKPYSIKVEPECMALLEKYRGRRYVLNVMDTYSTTKFWTAKVNKELQAICKELGLPRVSMYWTRHSWATIAAEMDIPRDTIGAALGHGGGTVTDIYINFDRNKIDRANRQVLDYVLYNKKQQDVYDLIRQLNENVASIANKAN